MRLCSSPKSFCWQVRLEWNLLQVKEGVSFQCGCSSEVHTAGKEKENMIGRKEIIFVVLCLRMSPSKMIFKSHSLSIYWVNKCGRHCLLWAGEEKLNNIHQWAGHQSSCGALKNEKLHPYLSRGGFWEFDVVHMKMWLMVVLKKQAWGMGHELLDF